MTNKIIAVVNDHTGDYVAVQKDSVGKLPLLIVGCPLVDDIYLAQRFGNFGEHVTVAIIKKGTRHEVSNDHYSFIFDGEETK